MSLGGIRLRSLSEAFSRTHGTDEHVKLASLHLGAQSFDSQTIKSFEQALCSMMRKKILDSLVTLPECLVSGVYVRTFSIVDVFFIRVAHTFWTRQEKLLTPTYFFLHRGTSQGFRTFVRFGIGALGFEMEWSQSYKLSNGWPCVCMNLWAAGDRSICQTGACYVKQNCETFVRDWESVTTQTHTNQTSYQYETLYWTSRPSGNRSSIDFQLSARMVRYSASLVLTVLLGKFAKTKTRGWGLHVRNCSVLPVTLRVCENFLQICGFDAHGCCVRDIERFRRLSRIPAWRGNRSENCLRNSFRPSCDSCVRLGPFQNTFRT